MLLVWLAVLLSQGFETWTLVRLGLLMVLAGAVGLHGYLIGSRMQALTERKTAGATVARDLTTLRQLSARITPVALVVSLLLAVLTLL